MPYIPDTNMSETDVTDVIHFFFLLDASGSMSGAAIETLNEAMANVLPAIQRVGNNKEVTPIVHVLAFNSGMQWLCGTSATFGIEAKDIGWNDISASGGTDTAGAITDLLEGLSQRHLGYHTYRPVIILITDGYSNDATATAAAVDKLVARQKSIRVAVGVNGYNAAELDTFASSASLTIVDDLGNEVTAREQKLIFPVDRADQLAYVIRDIAVSSLISSKLMGATVTKAETDGTVSGDEAPIPITVEEDNGWI